MFRNKLRFKKSKGFRKREIKVVNKPVYENPYFKKKKPDNVLRLLRPRSIGLILLTGGLIYLLFFAPYFRITEVEIIGNQELSYDTIKSKLDESFSESRYLVFNQSNFLIYDIDEAESKLWNAFVLDEVSVTKKFPNKLIITVKEKIPNLTLMTEKAFYYMDLQGVITHFVPEAEIKAFFPRVEDLNKRVIKLKDQVISAELVNAIIIIKDSFNKKIGTEIDRFLIPETNCSSKDSNTDTEDDIDALNNTNISNANTNKSTLNTNRTNSSTNSSNSNKNSAQDVKIECNLVQAIQDIAVLTTEGWKAYFTVNDDIATQIERLKVYLQKKSPTPEARENVEYIDLRFGEKIYVME